MTRRILLLKWTVKYTLIQQTRDIHKAPCMKRIQLQECINKNIILSEYFRKKPWQSHSASRMSCNRVARYQSSAGEISPHIYMCGIKRYLGKCHFYKLISLPNSQTSNCFVVYFFMFIWLVTFLSKSRSLLLTRTISGKNLQKTISFVLQSTTFSRQVWPCPFKQYLI